MTHHSGLGDYLGKYGDKIKEAIAVNKDAPVVPQLTSPKGFLQFADDQFYGVGKEHYSNLGILLVGLAIEHAYNKQNADALLTYDQILRQFIIDPAGISCFSTTMPSSGAYNPLDHCAPYLAGSPGGGYWTTSTDLAKFGQWVHQESNKSGFKELLIKFGEEFYNKDQDIVSHTGRMPLASANLTVSLRTGAVVAILADQPEVAIDMDAQVRKHILSTTGPARRDAATLRERSDQPGRSLSS